MLLLRKTTGYLGVLPTRFASPAQLQYARAIRGAGRSDSYQDWTNEGNSWILLDQKSGVWEIFQYRI